MVSRATGLRCRQIEETDLDAVTSLLARGFPERGRAFWTEALAQLKRHHGPPELPKYGYLLESDGRAVGAVLLICSTMRSADASLARCNLSSWYVEPPFRAYAPMLVSRALRHKNVTYLNVSSARHTRPIIEAQGFSRYADGIFIAIPLLNGVFGTSQVKVLAAEALPSADFDPLDRELLLRHAAYGCIALWCVTPDDASPFVFRPRVLRGLFPCAQLIYCRSVAEFVRFAGPIGRFLARHAKPVVLVDANGPIPGLRGWYSGGHMPKYFRGPQAPRLGDLAYTEYAVLGV